MNKARREKINSVKEELANLSSVVEALRDEEQDYYDNMPENLQSSERAELSEAAIDALDTALDSMEEAVASLDD